MKNHYREVLKQILAIIFLFGIVFGGLWLEFIGVNTKIEIGTIIDTKCRTLAHGSICYSFIKTSTGKNVKAISNCALYHNGRKVTFLVATGVFTGKTRYSVDCF